MKKLLMLKLTIFCLFAAFATLVAFGLLFQNEVLSFSGLMVFTVAAALATYYMVLTQT